jgi:ribonuclease HI
VILPRPFGSFFVLNFVFTLPSLLGCSRSLCNVGLILLVAQTGFILFGYFLQLYAGQYGRSGMLLSSTGSSRNLQLQLDIELFRSVTNLRPLCFRPSMLSEVLRLGYVSCIQQRVRVIALIWSRPSVGKLKVNIDGSYLGNPGHSGGGIVVRDSEANVVLAASYYFSMGTSLQAEIQSLKYALDLCYSHNLSDFVIESDSRLLVDFVHSRATWPWMYCDLLTEVCAKLVQARATIAHCFRETNTVADSLARIASSEQLTSSVLRE